MFEIELWNNRLCFSTEETLFSPQGPDRGTIAMLKNIILGDAEKVLDLGCGYGLVGVSISRAIGSERVVMTDVDERATKVAAKNAEANGVTGVKIVCGNALEGVEDRDFTLILSNPPYHTDFSVPKQFIEDGFRHLALGGKMVMVVKRLDWYKNKLGSVFGGVRVVEEDGYYILISEKRNLKVIKDKEKKTTKKHEKLQAFKKKR